VVLGTAHSAPDFTVPPDACDCHTHVFGPAGRFPLAGGRLYTPGDARVEDLLAHQGALGLDRVVVVQPSPYGADNACTLDALHRLGPARARGVAVIDDAATEADLAAMDAAGIRGARVNLETHGVSDPREAGAALAATARRIAPLGWHVQTYASLGLLAALHDVLMDLPVPLVVDHFGRPRAALGPSQPGFAALLALVGSGKACVKLSAPHRTSDAPGYTDAAPIVRAFLDANPDRLLWGSDWPHPGVPPGTMRDPDRIEPFRAEDDGAALNRLAHWVGDAALLQRILVGNPARLYGFRGAGGRGDAKKET
jgi:predicted TIM-barrel fold metal-dependent hydrolase